MNTDNITRVMNYKITQQLFFDYYIDSNFTILEKCLSLIDDKHNYIKWIKNLHDISENNEDLTNNFEYSFKKAHIYHLKKLLSISTELTELYNILIIDDFDIMIPYSIEYIYKRVQESYYNKMHNKIDETDIIYPTNFLFWNVDDFIDSVYAYITGDTICKINKWLDYFPQINKKTKELIISVTNKYYLRRTQERIKVYEKELIQKTWKPNRVYEWCFDEQEKADFV